jgi:hypothetical protein
MGQQAIFNAGLNIEGEARRVLSYFGGLRLINTAQTTWSGTGELVVGQIPGGGVPSVVENAVGATFTIATDAPMVQTEYGLGRVENHGTIIKSGASGISDWKVELVSDGLFHVQEGEVRLTGNGEGSGEFRVDAGARLTFGTVFSFEFKDGIRFTGDGEVVLDDTGSSYGVLVREEIELNRLTVSRPGRIGPSSDFGHINITELLELDGAFITPPITIRPGARLVQNGPNETLLVDLFVEGEVDVQEGTLSTFNGTIAVEPGGIVEIRDDAALSTVGLVNLPIQNSGTIQKTSGEGTAQVLAAFFERFLNNAGGLVHVASGTLDFADSNIVNEGGEWQIDAGATLLAPGSFGQVFELNSGTVRGGGTLAVRRLNNTGGTVSPGDSPGVLTVAAVEATGRPGDYTQGAEGTLEIEVGGPTPGAEHDQLAVAGTATLDGALAVSLINGFIPANDVTVTVLTAGAVAGEFAAINSTDLPEGIGVTAEYAANAVVLRFANDGSVDPVEGDGSDDGGDGEDGDDDADGDGGGDGGSGDDGAGDDMADDDGMDEAPSGGGGGRSRGGSPCGVGLVMASGWLFVAGFAVTGLRRRQLW